MELGRVTFCIHSFVQQELKDIICFELLKNRDLTIRLIYMRGQRGSVWPREKVGGLCYEMTPGGFDVFVNRLKHI